MTNMKTVLQYFKEKIDTCIENKQEIVRRKTMIEEYYRSHKNGNYYVSHPGQFDSIRRQLTVCGYLAEGTGSGFYRILKPIEPELNSGELRRTYDVMIKEKTSPRFYIYGSDACVKDEPKRVSIFQKLLNIFR